MPVPGPLELVVILVIALLILGPGRLPDVGSALGKSLREFRKAASDVQEATKIDVSPLPPTPATPSSAAPVAAASAPVAAPSVEAAGTATAEPVATTEQPDAESAS